MIDILNRNAVKSYASLTLQLFPAVYLFLRADGAPSPLFPLSLPPFLTPPPPPPPHTLSLGFVIAQKGGCLCQ